MSLMTKIKSNPKYMFIAIALLVAVVWFTGIFKRTRQLFSSIVSSGTSAQTEQYDEKGNVVAVSVRPTMTAADIRDVSNQMFYALLENTSEDEALFYSQLNRIRNQADWNAVVATFGIRNANGWLKFFEGTLPQAINTYLSTSEQIPMFDHFKKYNIVFQ